MIVLSFTSFTTGVLLALLALVDEALTYRQPHPDPAEFHRDSQTYHPPPQHPYRRHHPAPCLSEHLAYQPRRRSPRLKKKRKKSTKKREKGINKRASSCCLFTDMRNTFSERECVKVTVADIHALNESVKGRQLGDIHAL